MVKHPIGFRPPGQETAAVFARVPLAAARRLDRASSELRRPKGRIVAELLEALDTTGGELVLGSHQFRSDGPEEVLTLAEAAELLRVDERLVRELAGRGELPARKLGREWRFARRAILEWLAAS